MAFGDFVQARTSSITNTSLNLGNFAGVVTAGNTILVGVMISGSDAITVTDTLTNTYSADGSSFNAASSYYVHTFRASDILGGTNAVTINVGESREIYAVACEYEGNFELDQQTHATGTGLTFNSGNIITTVATELLFGEIAVPGSSQNYTPTTSFTQRGAPDGALCVLDRKVTATDTYNCAATGDTGNPGWGARVTSYSNADPEEPQTILHNGFIGNMIVRY